MPQEVKAKRGGRKKQGKNKPQQQATTTKKNEEEKEKENNNKENQHPPHHPKRTLPLPRSWSERQDGEREREREGWGREGGGRRSVPGSHSVLPQPTPPPLPPLPHPTPPTPPFPPPLLLCRWMSSQMLLFHGSLPLPPSPSITASPPQAHCSDKKMPPKTATLSRLFPTPPPHPFPPPPLLA